MTFKEDTPHYQESSTAQNVNEDTQNEATDLPCWKRADPIGAPTEPPCNKLPKKCEALSCKPGWNNGFRKTHTRKYVKRKTSKSEDPSGKQEWNNNFSKDHSASSGKHACNKNFVKEPTGMKSFKPKTQKQFENVKCKVDTHSKSMRYAALYKKQHGRTGATTLKSSRPTLEKKLLNQQTKVPNENVLSVDLPSKQDSVVQCNVPTLEQVPPQQTPSNQNSSPELHQPVQTDSRTHMQSGYSVPPPFYGFLVPYQYGHLQLMAPAGYVPCCTKPLTGGDEDKQNGLSKTSSNDENRESKCSYTQLPRMPNCLPARQLTETCRCQNFLPKTYTEMFKNVWPICLNS